jgi:hypothetical protein
MNTLIYVSTALYVLWIVYFTIMAWRCKSPAFGKTELVLIDLLAAAYIAVYLGWLVPLPAGWFIKWLMMFVIGVVGTCLHMLIHFLFSPFKPPFRRTWESWVERSFTIASF